MKTVCHNQLDFGSLLNLEIIADFEGGDITSDAGGILLKEVDHRYRVLEPFSQCLADDREESKVKHSMINLFRQRVYQIAMGYEDQNDADRLRRDPSLKSMVKVKPRTEPDLGSQPTLSRFENSRTEEELDSISNALISLYIKVHPGPRSTIVLDIDGTDDPTHGQQEFTFYHGYYGQYMYHPLFIFDGVSGFPLAAVLRPGNTHAGHDSVAILGRVVSRLQEAYPEATIILRADAGFALPEMYEYCESNDIRYVIGLITNDRLRKRVSKLAKEVERRFAETEEKQRAFTDFYHKAGSWPNHRRVIAKVERLSKGLNQRFVVTNLNLEPYQVYDLLYTQRGDAENRIKELKNQLKADRLSCPRFNANQFRLLLHTIAYCLFILLRRHLEETELESAQVDTIRLKLIKIGARVRETSRKIWFHLASGYPYADLLARTLGSIRAVPT